MLTARTVSIPGAVFPYEPGGIVPGQTLGFQGHYYGAGIQEPVVMVVTVNNRVIQEPGRWIPEWYGHVKAPGQGLEC